MTRAYLFDLDGTLQDTEVLYVEAWRLAYQERGCPVSADEAHRIVYGRANTDVFSLFQALYPDAYPTIEAIEASLSHHFLGLRSTRDVRIAGSIALLHRLAERHPVAVVSGNARANVAEAIDLLGIGPKLAFHLGCEDYTPGKPDPACFRLAAERLGVPARACVVFEDSELGVRAAKAAGMTCVALRRPGAPLQDVSAADEVLPDLALYRAGGWD